MRDVCGVMMCDEWCVLGDVGGVVCVCECLCVLCVVCVVGGV